ncbi:Flp pilus assembly protein CpaB [Aliiroseovarius sp. YM-037]|uniref:Flp pilus assembly protein CpaB n=1 Tax=Aliiroseovarius sp. YM-037 TaxID=3341728 RepID=UPI003A813C04
MRLVFGLVLIVGIGLAGFAVYMAKGYMGNYREELARERAARAAMVKTEDVFVVTRQLRYGEQLTAEDVRLVKWPEDAIPDGAFQSLETLFPEGRPNFRTITRTMEIDEAVMALKVTEPGMDAGITSRLERGMRAFAIKVDVTSGVSGFLRPGDRVDVYWTGQSLDQEVTKLIQTGVQLVAIDQSANDDLGEASVARTITVQVTPQEVASLAQAQATGRLTLALVGAEDDTVAEAIEVDQNMLLGIEQRQTVEIQQEEVCTTWTRRGTEKVEVRIPCPN